MNRLFSFNDQMESKSKETEDKGCISQENYYRSGKAVDNSWTDMRVQEIKKKYESPSNRNLIESKSRVMVDKSYLVGKSINCKGESSYQRRPLRDANAQVQSSKPRVESIKQSWKEGQIFEKENQVGRFSLGEASKISNKWNDLITKASASHLANYRNPSAGETNFSYKPLRERSAYYVQKTDQNFYHQNRKDQKASLDKNKSQKSYCYRASFEKGHRQLSKNSHYEKRRDVCDPRIQNIDKINIKIKNILECLDQNQKQLESNERQCEPNSLLKKSSFGHNSFLDKSVISREFRYQGRQFEHQNQFQETKIIEKQKIYYKEDQKNNRNSQKSYNYLDQNVQRGKYSQYPNQFFGNRENRFKEINQKIKSQPVFDGKVQRDRSSSYLERYTNNQREYSQEKVYLFQKTGRLNSEINKFENKINELEEQKRKLNIDFKPFAYEKSPIKANLITENNQQAIYSNYLRSSIPKTDQRYVQIGRNIQYFDKTQKLQSEERYKRCSSRIKTVEDCNYPKKFTFSNILNEDMNQCINKQSHKDQINEEKYQENKYDNEELRRKINERMQDRKRKLEMFEENAGTRRTNRKTDGLIEALVQQVKLDQEFRNSKYWFSELHQPDKYYSLARFLEKQGVRMTQEDLISQFDIFDEESDPFFSFREEKYSIEVVAKNYVKCNSFWSNEVMNKWDMKTIFEEENLLQKLDLKKKKYCVLEDFVRLLNFNSGAFYRNRDIVLIFKRICGKQAPQGEEKLQIQQLYHVLGHL